MKEYKDLIDETINKLIEKKDFLVQDIEEVSTFLDMNQNDNTLSNWEVDYINSRRKKMRAIYDLIEKLEDLKVVK